MSRSTAAMRMAARAMIETDRLLGVTDVPGAVGASVSENAVAAPVPEATSTAPVTDTEGSNPPRPLPAPAIDPVSLDEDVVAALERLESLHAERCGHCTNSTTHRSVVFGDGDPHASVMFVGEAPGAEEDRTGRPFVGPAGELLDRMIESVGLSREGVYIGNIIKVRPQENRTPSPDECEVCGPWLLAQIAVIRPRVVVALGATPTKYLLQTTTGITRLRGCSSRIRIGDFSVPVVPTFHPAYVLRQYTPEVRRAVWEDLKQAVAISGED